VQRGFSLVETLVATTLLAGALVVLAQFVSAAVESGTAARVRAISTHMAVQKMEEIRSLPWASISAMPPESIDYLDDAGRQRCGSAAVPCGDARYVRRWSAINAPFSADVRVIHVEVSPVGKAQGATALVSARARLTP
jgi:prepilin-type N-terminal cleavage/methylation domain-containing protein